MIIKFTYDEETDKKCWQRYDDFIKKNKTVWGISKEIKQIFLIDEIKMKADVSYMAERFDKVFGIKKLEVDGFVVTTPFSMINDDDMPMSEKGIIYYSLYTPNPSIVIAHELFHIYFEKYTKRNIPNYEESKEYFTVIMNDLFNAEVSKGYPVHQEIREKIFKSWKDTNSIDRCIEALFG